MALQQLLPLVQVVSNTERSSVEADTHQEHNIKMYNLKKNCVAVESYNDKYCVFFFFFFMFFMFHPHAVQAQSYLNFSHNHTLYNKSFPV